MHLRRPGHLSNDRKMTRPPLLAWAGGSAGPGGAGPLLHVRNDKVLAILWCWCRWCRRRGRSTTSRHRRRPRSCSRWRDSTFTDGSRIGGNGLTNAETNKFQSETLPKLPSILTLSVCLTLHHVPAIVIGCPQPTRLVDPSLIPTARGTGGPRVSAHIDRHTPLGHTALTAPSPTTGRCRCGWS